MLVDVVFGGPGREAAVSKDSGRAIVAALQQLDGMDVAAVECADVLDLARLRSGAIIFNIIHGTYGEDGTLQQALQDAGYAFVGSDAAVSKRCMDKQAIKQLAHKHEVPTAWGGVIDGKNPSSVRDLRPPQLTGLVIKPRRDGSSVGLRMVPNPGHLIPALEELITDLGPIEFLIEERLRGPEYTVGVICDEHGAPQVLPPLCIRPASDTYDYAAKYQRDDTSYDAVTDALLSQQLQTYARTMYEAAGCKHLARIDFMDAGNNDVRLLEINTLPGFTSHSLVPKMAAMAGLSFAHLCQRLVVCAANEAGGPSHG